MGKYLIYFVQSNIILIVFYVIFAIFFSKDSNVKFSRFFLLTGLIFAIFLPFFSINIYSGENNILNLSYNLTPIFVSPSKIIENNINYLRIVFISVSSLFAINFIFQLFRIIFIIQKSQKVDDIFLVENKYSNFSFFNKIFIRRNDYQSPNFYRIYEHEKIHVKQLHSFDKIFLELLMIFLWINPFYWLYKRALFHIHEFLADKELISKKYEVESYMQLLIMQAFGKNFQLINNFNKSLTLKRLRMMKTQSPKKNHNFKVLFVVPVLSVLMLLFLFTFSCTKKDIKEVKSTKPAIVLAQYPGGEKALHTDISDIVKYPEEAKQNNIQGVVLVEFTVSKDGYIKNPTITRSANKLLDDEVIRVINSLKKRWKPATKNGKPIDSKMTLPITFSL